MKLGFELRSPLFKIQVHYPVLQFASNVTNVSPQVPLTS